VLVLEKRATGSNPSSFAVIAMLYAKKEPPFEHLRFGTKKD
jgi:hypothetical protein